MDTLKASGAEEIIGESSSLLAPQTLFESTHYTLQRAGEIVAQEA
jgi:hypothetical protein